MRGLHLLPQPCDRLWRNKTPFEVELHRAGLLGIAGAMLFNPFLLAMGVHPQVVAATAIVIVLFGSGAISLSFW